MRKDLAAKGNIFFLTGYCGMSQRERKLLAKLKGQTFGRL